LSVELEGIHVINIAVEINKSCIFGDDVGVFGKSNVIIVHCLIDRHADVNFPTKVNTEFYWRISRQRNGVGSGTKVTVLSAFNR
jgi:hypothetical protein